MEEEENYSLQTEPTREHKALSGTDSILCARCKSILWEAPEKGETLANYNYVYIYIVIISIIFIYLFVRQIGYCHRQQKHDKSLFKFF